MPGTSAELVEAMTLHRAGRLPEARALYGSFLRASPDQPDALNFLGMLEFQAGDRALGISLLRRSVECAPANPHAWLNLGNMLAATAGPDEGVAAYRRAIAADASIPEAWYNLGVCLRRVRQFDAAVVALTRAVELRPAYSAAYEALGSLLYKLDRLEAAAALYRTWARVEPGHPVATHMAAATATGDTPARAGDAYVTRLFDGYAASFDESLAALAYRAPQLIGDALAMLGGYQSGALEVLDAGCGTGLCGPLLRSSARRLVGVDLSPRMIDRARERAIYDELIATELTGYLAACQAAYDLVVSADTLCYFGDLAPVVRAAQGCLRRGGVLMVTVEELREDSGAGYRLLPSGRYAHADSYVRDILAASGFQLRSIERATLRRERGADVAGLVVTAEVNE